MAVAHPLSHSFKLQPCIQEPRSNSYTPSAFELVQRMSQRQEGPTMAATFSDGSKIPTNYSEARRIFAEAAQAPSFPDAAGPEAAPHVGTPRQTTGFHVSHQSAAQAQQQHQPGITVSDGTGSRTPGSMAGSAASSRGSSPRTSLPPSASAFASTANMTWTDSSSGESRPPANGGDPARAAPKRSATPELAQEHKPRRPAVDRPLDRGGEAQASQSKSDGAPGKPETASSEPAKAVSEGSKGAVKAGGDAVKGPGKGDRLAGGGEAGKAGAETGKPPAAKGDKAGAGKEKEAGEKKPTTKAERRALQEKQRAEKAAAKEAAEGGKPTGGKAGGDGGKQGAAKQAPTPRAVSAGEPGSSKPAPAARDPPTPPQGARQGQRAKPAKRGAESGMTTSSEMFAHLQQYRAVSLDSVMQESSVAAKVHPAVLRLGLQYASGEVAGGNARCLAMLLTFRQVIQDYQTPESKILSRDLTAQLNLCIQFLVECRPLSVSMGTAIKHLKLKVSTIDASTPQEAAKAALLEEINTFVQEKITFADEHVAQLAQAKVASGDVVLTYAFSSAVFNTFVAAQKEGKRFRVVAVDSRPHQEGRRMLHMLLARGIPCTYIHLNALSYTMQEVSKVFLGAAGVMSNGTVIARAGSAAVAMMAHAAQRPVIICCETLKFHERVQLDSITSNELGDPHALADVPGRPDVQDLRDWEDDPRLELLNLVYDAMPCEYVTVIITEVGAIPPTSVPVILREYRSDPKM